MTPVRKAALALIAGFCVTAGAAEAQDADFVAAAGRGDLTTVTAMLKAGVKPDTAWSGRTAIVAASMTGQLDVVRALLAAKANPEAGATTATGTRSALIWALRNGHDPVALALAKGGANLRARDEDGIQALWLAAGHDSADSVAVVQIMKPAYTVADLESALPLAAQSGSAEMVKLLVVTGVRVDGANPEAQTPLMRAAARGRADVMRVLLAAGADVNARRGDGTTALMMAVGSGRADAVQVLLAARADVNARTRDGNTALARAIPTADIRSRRRNGSAETIKLLEAAQVDVRGVRTRAATPAAVVQNAPASAASTIEIVRLLLDAGADTSARRSDGYTALMLAVERGYQDLVDLMERGKAVSARD